MRAAEVRRFYRYPFGAGRFVIVVALVLLVSGFCMLFSEDAGCGDPRVDLIKIDKSARKLSLFAKGELVSQYSIALGPEPIGPKRSEGDGRTPEGNYVIDSRNPHSQFYKSLHISYPNQNDRAQSQRLGVRPGANIMIHGIKNGLGWLGPLHRLSDWTQGCIAVTDSEIDEIWRLVPDSTKVEIAP